MKVRLIAILGVLMFAVPASAAPGDETPQWVQQAATIKVPNYDKDVPAVVLVDEQSTTIASDGRTPKSTTTPFAFSGAKDASMRLPTPATFRTSAR